MVKDILRHEITGTTILLCHMLNRTYVTVIHVNVQFHCLNSFNHFDLLQYLYYTEESFMIPVPDKLWFWKKDLMDKRIFCMKCR